jgi:hypothetical protein
MGDKSSHGGSREAATTSQTVVVRGKRGSTVMPEIYQKPEELFKQKSSRQTVMGVRWLCACCIVLTLAVDLPVFIAAFREGRHMLAWIRVCLIVGLSAAVLAALAHKSGKEKAIWLIWPLSLFAIVALELSITFVAKLPETALPGMFLSAIMVVYTAPGQPIS